MFDAAAPARIRTLEEPPRGPLWPVSLVGALLLHLGGFGLTLWLAVPARLPRATEPTIIELSLEPIAPAEAEAATVEPPEEIAPEPSPPAAEAPPPAPAPLPALPEPVEPAPSRPEPPRQAAPRPRAQPPQQPRERRAAGNPAPPAPAPSPSSAAPGPPAGPPIVTNPRFRRPPTPPDYPLVARERGVTGTAVIRALVGTDGETREVRLHRSSGHEILDQSALAAARRWSFEPSARDGQRIEAWIEVPIRFQLR